MFLVQAFGCRSRPSLRLVACVFLLLAATEHLLAQAPGQVTPPSELKSLSLEELSKLEVTSVSKEANPAFRTAAAISVLTQDDIRRSGATSIPDLLRLLPGVEVAQIDSNKWAIGIRGFQGRLSKSVLVLIDGRSVYTPLFGGVYWEMQDMMLENIDRIEVIRGPGGTIWGADAVNGVINIITKAAQETRGTVISGGGGNVDQGFLGASYGAGTDALSYRVSANGFTRAPQFHPNGETFDDWRRAQAGFRLDWKPSAADTVNISAGAYQMIAGSDLGISSFSPPALLNVRDNGYFSGQNVVLGWRRALQSGSDVQVRGYYDRTNRDDLNYREVRQTADLDLIYHTRLERHELIGGAGIRISPSQFTQKTPSVDFLPHSLTYSIYSGFLQDSIAIMPNKLMLTLGTKLEYNSFSGFEFQPSGRFAWTPNEQQTVWGAVTRAVRTPSQIEEGFQFNALASANPPLYLRLIGDGQFSPEQLIGYELGYRTYVKGGGFISISGFYNQYDDLLSVENRPPSVETSPSPAHLVLPLFLRNGIRANTAGFEVASLWDVRRWWRVRGSYSYMNLNAKRKPDSNDASTVAQLEGDSPRHSGLVQSYLNLPGALQLNLTYRYVGALKAPDQKVSAYSTGDAVLSKRITRNLELSIAGRNLFQPSHPEYAGEPGGLIGIRRSAYLRFAWVQ